MISELRVLIVPPIAMILFLCAVSTSPGLTLRANPTAPVAGTGR
jgi:hypothetical protein